MVDKDSIKNKIYGPMMRICEHFWEVSGKSMNKCPERKVKLFSGSDVSEDWFVPIWEGPEQEARVLEETNQRMETPGKRGLGESKCVL